MPLLTYDELKRVQKKEFTMGAMFGTFIFMVLTLICVLMGWTSCG